MKKLVALLLTLFQLTAHGQTNLIGKYSDGLTQLTINADSTFHLSTPDPVFPNTYTIYQNTGHWASSGNKLILNPGKEKKATTVSVSEKVIENADSIQVKINYTIAEYENGVFIKKIPSTFELMTIYINRSKNYNNIVHHPIRSTCAFAPRVKKQIVADAENSFKLPKQKVEWIGIYSYGFDKEIQLTPADPNANYFEISIIQPIDKNRMPSNKQVIIKGNNAYFYEYKGKIPTSGILNRLKRLSS